MASPRGTWGRSAANMRITDNDVNNRKRLFWAVKVAPICTAHPIGQFFFFSFYVCSPQLDGIPRGELLNNSAAQIERPELPAYLLRHKRLHASAINRILASFVYPEAQSFLSSPSMENPIYAHFYALLFGWSALFSSFALAPCTRILFWLSLPTMHFKAFSFSRCAATSARPFGR